MSDAVDALLGQWRRERPDLDPWPMGIVGRVSRLSRLLERSLGEFFSAYGLEHWEFDVLAALRRAGKPYELTAGGLLDSAMVTSGAITNRIDRLAAKGLVERVPNPEDRRSVRVRLTQRGLQLTEELVPLHIANEARLLSALDEPAREQLTATLRLLLESLGDTRRT